jgi:hypothetical protein
MGDNFGVTESGTVYAKGAYVGGNIYADYIEANNGTIGGWVISGDGISKGKMKIFSKGSNGTITADKFSVDVNGVLTATDATLTTLTVNNKLSVAKGTGTGDVDIAGNTEITGTSTLTGAVTIGKSGAEAS